MGFPGSMLLSPKDIRTTTSDKRHPLGTRGYTRDGRVFRYAHAGATNLVIGLMNQSTPTDTDFNDTVDLAVAATSISTSLTLESTATSITTANVFADGYIATKDATGQGQLMQIKSHPTKDTASTTCKFNLFEDSYLTASVTTGTSIFGIFKNPYQDVIVCPGSAPTGIAVGVNIMAVTAKYYFWIQTWGPCAVKLTAAAVVTGSGVTIDSSSAGSVKTVGSTGNSTTTLLLMHTRPMLGVAMEVSASSDHGLIYLTLAP